MFPESRLEAQTHYEQRPIVRRMRESTKCGERPRRNSLDTLVQPDAETAVHERPHPRIATSRVKIKIGVKRMRMGIERGLRSARLNFEIAVLKCPGAFNSKVVTERAADCRVQNIPGADSRFSATRRSIETYIMVLPEADRCSRLPVTGRCGRGKYYRQRDHARRHSG